MIAKTLSSLSILCLVAGCGGSTPEPKEPEPKKEAAASEEPTAPAEEEGAASKKKKEGAKDEEASDEPASKEKESAKPTHSPKEILTTEGMLFSFSFKESDVYQTAEKECAEKAGNNPQKKADCMTKAGASVEADSMIFKKETDGKWSWITAHRAGSKVTVLHKFEIEFGEETANSITLKPKGRDQGTKHMATPAKVVIDVNESGIVVTDPKLGKMVYVGKLGQVGDVGR